MSVDTSPATAVRDAAAAPMRPPGITGSEAAALTTTRPGKLWERVVGGHFVLAKRSFLAELLLAGRGPVAVESDGDRPDRGRARVAGAGGRAARPPDDAHKVAHRLHVAGLSGSRAAA